MTGGLLFLTGCALTALWIHHELTHPLDEDTALLALAEAVGVVPEPDPVKVAATREALRIEALATAEARRDLTDERLAAWLAGAE